MPEFKVGDILRYRTGGDAHPSFYGKRVEVIDITASTVRLLDDTTSPSFKTGKIYNSSLDTAVYEYAELSQTDLLFT